jgi:hypothetical protein
MNHVLRTGVLGSGDHVTEVIEQPHSTLAAVKKELDQASCNGFWREQCFDQDWQLVYQFGCVRAILAKNLSVLGGAEAQVHVCWRDTADLIMFMCMARMAESNQVHIGIVASLTSHPFVVSL